MSSPSRLQNIVLIVADTLGSPEQIPGCDVDARMPFFSRLARDGVRAPRFLASSSWTYPSHQSLLVGDNPWAPQLGHLARSERIRRRSLASLWGEAGGESIAVSANPIVNREDGLLQRFQHAFPQSRFPLSRLGVLAMNVLDPWLSCASTAGVAAPNAPSIPGADRGGHLRRFAGVAADESSTVLAHFARRSRRTENLLGRLSSFLAVRNGSKPLLAFVNLMEPHEPYFEPRWSTSSRGDQLTLPTNSLAAHSADISSRPELQLRLQRAYLRALSETDRAISQIFSFFADRALMDGTLFLLVSDHGQCLGEDGFFGHGTQLNDQLVIVPCLFWSKTVELSSINSLLRERWLDHRHLYELVASFIQSGISVPGLDDASAMLARRGPATSYVRELPWGLRRDPRLVDSVVHRVRVNVGVSSCIVERRGRFVSTQKSVGPEGELARSEANRALDSALGGGEAEVARMLGVEARLRSWGYP